jgi:hypothetical protein
MALMEDAEQGERVQEGDRTVVTKDRVPAGVAEGLPTAGAEQQEDQRVDNGDLPAKREHP